MKNTYLCLARSVTQSGTETLLPQGSGYGISKPGTDISTESQAQGSHTQRQIAFGMAALLHANPPFDSLPVTKNGLACTTRRPYCPQTLECLSYTYLGRHCNWPEIDLLSCKKKQCLTLAVGDFLLSEATRAYPRSRFGDNASFAFDTVDTNDCL